MATYEAFERDMEEIRRILVESENVTERRLPSAVVNTVILVTLFITPIPPHNNYL